MNLFLILSTCILKVVSLRNGTSFLLHIFPILSPGQSFVNSIIWQGNVFIDYAKKMVLISHYDMIDQVELNVQPHEQLDSTVILFQTQLGVLTVTFTDNLNNKRTCITKICKLSI